MLRCFQYLLAKNTAIYFLLPHFCAERRRNTYTEKEPGVTALPSRWHRIGWRQIHTGMKVTKHFLGQTHNSSSKAHLTGSNTAAEMRRRGGAGGVCPVQYHITNVWKKKPQAQWSADHNKHISFTSTSLSRWNIKNKINHSESPLIQTSDSGSIVGFCLPLRRCDQLLLGVGEVWGLEADH